MSAAIDAAWRRALGVGAGIHTTGVTAESRVVLRSLDWGWEADGGIAEQTWTTGLGPGAHTVTVTTAVIGAPTRLSGSGTADVLLVGDLQGEQPDWRRVEGDLPFRRGVAIVPDLGSEPAAGGEAAAGTPWSEVRRTLQTFTDSDGRKTTFAIEAFGHPLRVNEHDGVHAVAATSAVGLPSTWVDVDGSDSEVVTHGWAERWEGMRDGRLVAVALDIGAGLRRTLDGLRMIEDPWVAPVGTALACGPDEVGPEPEYSDESERMRYSDAFVPRKHVSGRAVTVDLGTIRFPSGIATVVNPTMPGAATDLVLAFPTDRDLPCFVAPTVQGNGDLLIRTGDATPTVWRRANLRPQPLGVAAQYGRGLIAICDRGFADRLQDDEAFARRISGLAVSLNPMVLHDPDSGVEVGAIISTEGNLMVRPLLGLDADGAVAAVSLEAADAADIGMWR